MTRRDSRNEKVPPGVPFRVRHVPALQVAAEVEIGLHHHGTRNVDDSSSRKGKKFPKIPKEEGNGHFGHFSIIAARRESEYVRHTAVVSDGARSRPLQTISTVIATVQIVWRWGKEGVWNPPACPQRR